MTDTLEKEIRKLFGGSRHLERDEIADILLSLLARIQYIEDKLKEKNS